MSIQQALEWASDYVRSLQAEVALAHILGLSRTYLYAHPEDELTLTQQKKYAGWIAKLSQDYPLAYLTHYKEFYDLTFYVDRRVLIPRPLTEEIVDLARAHLTARRPVCAGRLAGRQARILDLGTGSGCLAITLKKHFPAALIWAVDIDPLALQVASLNAQRLLNHQSSPVPIHFQPSHLFASICHTFDLIVANLPYLKPEQVLCGQPCLKHEPWQALVDETSPSLITQLIQQAPQYLRQGGRLIYEDAQGVHIAS